MRTSGLWNLVFEPQALCQACTSQESARCLALTFHPTQFTNTAGISFLGKQHRMRLWFGGGEGQCANINRISGDCLHPESQKPPPPFPSMLTEQMHPVLNGTQIGVSRPLFLRNWRISEKRPLMLVGPSTKNQTSPLTYSEARQLGRRSPLTDQGSCKGVYMVLPSHLKYKQLMLPTYLRKVCKPKGENTRGVGARRQVQNPEPKGGEAAQRFGLLSVGLQMDILNIPNLGCTIYHDDMAWRSFLCSLITLNLLSYLISLPGLLILKLPINIHLPSDRLDYVSTAKTRPLTCVRSYSLSHIPYNA